TPSYSRMPAETTCATYEFWCNLPASIRSWTSPPCKNFLNSGLNICDWRKAARKRRCLSTIIPTENTESRARQIITAPPNKPTCPISSVKVMVSLPPWRRCGGRRCIRVGGRTAGVRRFRPDFVVTKHSHEYLLVYWQPRVVEHRRDAGAL